MIAWEIMNNYDPVLKRQFSYYLGITQSDGVGAYLSLQFMYDLLHGHHKVFYTLYPDIYHVHQLLHVVLCRHRPIDIINWTMMMRTSSISTMEHGGIMVGPVIVWQALRREHWQQVTDLIRLISVKCLCLVIHGALSTRPGLFTGVDWPLTTVDVSGHRAELSRTRTIWRSWNSSVYHVYSVILDVV